MTRLSSNYGVYLRVECIQKILLVVTAFIVVSCKEPIELKETSIAYHNLNDTVKYVGKTMCVQCHSDVWHTFQHTGMGSSFGRATREKSIANFHDSIAPVYDSILNYYYRPFWKDSILFIEEYRLVEGKKVHSRTEEINYIIGSGQHTNSHLIERNGFITQAPITYYKQREKWDLAPGFENGFNSRFTRLIGKECMTCHNAIPEHDARSINNFRKIPLGIDCERCHGPGELHVKRMMNEQIVDTAKFIDSSIVNPKDLSLKLQNSLCQRCHLQGVSVLKEGMDYDDFRPGMLLSDVMDIYLPASDNDESQMIMASHVQRLKKSKCFIAGEMSCLTCHNPHKSVTKMDKQFFDGKCISCHHDYTLHHSKIDAESIDNCVDCHMPKSGSIDIPHVAVTDHFIRVPGGGNTMSKNTDGLECLNNDKVLSGSKLKAYVNYFEKYSNQDRWLDSASVYANRETSVDLLIHLNYLKQDYLAVINYANESTSAKGWTNYRIAESFIQQKAYKKALNFIEKAVKDKPLINEFQLKKAMIHFKMNDLVNAEKSFRYVLLNDSNNTKALTSLGYILFSKNRYDEAEKYLKKALDLDPDYELAFRNYMQFLRIANRTKEMKELLDWYLIQHPNFKLN